MVVGGGGGGGDGDGGCGGDDRGDGGDFGGDDGGEFAGDDGGDLDACGDCGVGLVRAGVGWGPGFGGRSGVWGSGWGWREVLMPKLPLHFCGCVYYLIRIPHVSFLEQACMLRCFNYVGLCSSPFACLAIRPHA